MATRVEVQNKPKAEAGQTDKALFDYAYDDKIQSKNLVVPKLAEDTFEVLKNKPKANSEEIANLKQKIGLLISEHDKIENIEDKLSNSFSIAVSFFAIDDKANYEKWKKESLEIAAQMPAGRMLAYPLTKADFDMVEGSLEEAIENYRKGLNALKILDVFNDVKLATKNICDRLKQILSVHALELMSSMKSYTDFEMRDKIVDCFKEIYKLSPSEDALYAIFGAYAALGWDLPSIKGGIEVRTRLIEEESSHMVSELFDGDDARELSGRKLKMLNKDGKEIIIDIGGAKKNPASTFDGAVSDVMGSNSNSFTISNLGLDFIKPEYQKIIADLEKTIKETNKHDQQQLYIHLAELYAHIDDRSSLKTALENAHLSFVMYEKKCLESKVELDSNKIFQDVSILHRLASLLDTAYRQRKAVLFDARENINKFLKVEPSAENWALLMLENTYLQADLEEDIARSDYYGKKIDEKELYEKSLDGYNKALDFAFNNLKLIKTKEAQEQFAGIVLDIERTLLEKNLAKATMFRIEGEKEKAQIATAKAVAFNESVFNVFGKLLNSEDFAEAKAATEYVIAYHSFRSGDIQDTIAKLKGIKENYPTSSAAADMFLESSWPAKFYITNTDGTWTANLEDTSVSAMLKTMAGQLDEENGRALAACGVGAAAYVGLDLLFGEKVSGAGVIVACTAAYAADRSFVVGEAWDSVMQSYDLGVSNVDFEEAALNSGLFALELASTFAGAVVGVVAERVALRVGMGAKKGIILWLGKRGALSGPWKRSTARFFTNGVLDLQKVKPGFILREVSKLGNAFAFHNTTSAIRSAVQGQGPGRSRDNDDLLNTWLYVRFLPLFYDRLNFGGRLITGTASADAVAKFGVNTLVASAALQGVMGAIGSASKGKYEDRVARSFIDLALIRAAGKGVEATLDSKLVARLGRQLESVLPSKLKGRNVIPEVENNSEEVNGAGEKGSNENGFGKKLRDFWNVIRNENADLWAIRWFVRECIIHPIDFVRSLVTGAFNVIAVLNPAKIFGKGKEQSGNAVDAEPAIETPKNESSWMRTAFDTLFPKRRQLSSLEANQKMDAVESLPTTLPPAETFWGNIGRWFVVRIQAIKNAFTEARETPWEHVNPQNPAIVARTVKKNTPPWQKEGEFSDAKQDEVIGRLQKGVDDRGQPISSEVFTPKKSKPEVVEYQSIFKKVVHGTFNFISNIMRAIGGYFVNQAKKAGDSNPRTIATRTVAEAKKDTQRETVRPTLEEKPPWLNIFWDAIRGPEKSNFSEAAQQKEAYQKALRTGDTSELSWPQKIMYYKRQVADPLFEAAHLFGLGLAVADFTVLDGDGDWEKEDLIDGDIDTLSGSISFVLGSNYIAALAGITTMGGGLYAELFKTVTWGMMVSMEGSDPFKYFSQKPDKIAILHAEYFVVLMGQVILFSGMHSKPGNPIYKFITNIPVFRAMPSLTRFYKYYTPRSTMTQPDFVGFGRWLSLAFVGPFQMGVAEVTSDKKYLDAHWYLKFHRLFKSVHLGLWLKPLGAKLNQAGTFGQFVERGVGLIVDWFDALVTPVFIGKGEFKNRMKDNLITGEFPDETKEAAEQLKKAARTSHEIYRKATQSLDICGWLGNTAAKEIGFGDDRWRFRTGWRTEIEGLKSIVNAMKVFGEEEPASLVNDAMQMHYKLLNPDEVGVDLESDRDAVALLIHSLHCKMLAERGMTDPKYGAYYDLVYNNEDEEMLAKYWNGLPTPADEAQLYKMTQQINSSELDMKLLLKPLQMMRHLGQQ